MLTALASKWSFDTKGAWLAFVSAPLSLPGQDAKKDTTSKLKQASAPRRSVGKSPAAEVKITKKVIKRHALKLRRVRL